MLEQDWEEMKLNELGRHKFDRQNFLQWAIMQSCTLTCSRLKKMESLTDLDSQQKGTLISASAVPAARSPGEENIFQGGRGGP